MGAVLLAKTGVTSGTNYGDGAGVVKFGYHTALIKVRCSSAGNLTINGQTVPFAVTTDYQDFFVDDTSVTVASGTFDIVAIG